MASAAFRLFYPLRYLLSILLVWSYAATCMAEQKGAAFFDFGVFAFEEGDYEGAEKNFLNAIKANPRNGDFHHYLGKTYLKTGRFKEAENALNQAWQYQSAMEGLKYDMAIVQYQIGAYPVASFLFADELFENPSNVLAQYYLGICMYKRQQYKNALEHFEKATQKNPSIKPNGFFFAGICHMQLRETERAVEKFSWVAENAQTDELKTNAVKWLQTAQALTKEANPLRLNLKIGAQYDDNVALEPADQDIYADEGSFGFTAYLSAKYRLLQYNNLSTGIGYNHYQSIHFDLSEYNLMGSIPNLYVKFNHKPWILGLSIQPTYYWLDTNKYMLRKQFSTDLIWNITGKLAGRYAIIFFDENNYITSGKNGRNIQFLMDAFYRIPEKKISLIGGIGFDHSNTDHADYQYTGFQTRIGMDWGLPREFVFSPSVRITNKQYAHTHSFYNKKRDDLKYELAASISRKMIYQWLTGGVEYKYTKNDSNIAVYGHQSHKAAFIISAAY
ncbi:MAG: tetratricopeptide repeat protein [Desulfobacteraceae bacterium]|nr:MAG: tetratricopeptide repeat protein [Desulfobacteraceae bacterium]